jgi:hypothetical protein
MVGSEVIFVIFAPIGLCCNPGIAMRFDVFYNVYVITPKFCPPPMPT